MVQFQVLPPLQHPPTVPLPEEIRNSQSRESSRKAESVGISLALAEVKQAQSIFCRLWVIVNEVYFIYRDDKLSAKSLGFALGKYNKLLELAGTLPQSMLRLGKTPHWVLILQ